MSYFLDLSDAEARQDAERDAYEDALLSDPPLFELEARDPETGERVWITVLPDDACVACGSLLGGACCDVGSMTRPLEVTG